MPTIDPKIVTQIANDAIGLFLEYRGHKRSEIEAWVDAVTDTVAGMSVDLDKIPREVTEIAQLQQAAERLLQEAEMHVSEYGDDLSLPCLTTDIMTVARAIPALLREVSVLQNACEALRDR